MERLSSVNFAIIPFFLTDLAIWVVTHILKGKCRIRDVRCRLRKPPPNPVVLKVEPIQSSAVGSDPSSAFTLHLDPLVM